jgi:hypothetical protein
MHKQHQPPGSYFGRAVPVSIREAKTTITAEVNLPLRFIAQDTGPLELPSPLRNQVKDE